jgi:lipopolysaccharide transport system ATP-binding protein
MSDVAIRVEGLGKQYRLGAPRERYSTLRDQVQKWTSLRGLLRRAARAEHRPLFWALKDVSFEVQRGEVVGIIGRNGAGKSTLLKILSRITEPTEGEAQIHGRVGSLLEVGTGFHPELTGRENVYLNGAILGMKRAEINRKFDEIVAFAEVEEFIDTPVKHYSSGMYMRLAFAVAAHLELEILVVDEVLAVGDSQFQKKCIGKMGEVAGCGRTVLFVSHNMSAIQQLCSRGLLLRGGRVHLAGPVGPVIQEYLSDAIAATDGRFDVSDHPGRHRHFRPIIRKVVLAAADGQPRVTFHPQDALVIGLDLVPGGRIRKPRIAIAIEDAQGRRVMTVANYFSPIEFPELERSASVRCTIPRIGLGTGRYLISASIGEGHHGLLDALEAIGWFEVEWDNNFGTGEPHYPFYGPVLCDSEWRLEPVGT